MDKAVTARENAFGYPRLLLREYSRWRVLLREKQVTLGSMIVMCREPVGEFPAISSEAMAELHKVIEDVERVARGWLGAKKVNYLMLMMVDPEVHFHVLPRYSEDKEYGGFRFRDAAWPGPPDFKAHNDAPESVLMMLRDELLARLGS